MGIAMGEGTISITESVFSTGVSVSGNESCLGQGESLNPVFLLIAV